MRHLSQRKLERTWRVWVWGGSKEAGFCFTLGALWKEDNSMTGYLDDCVSEQILSVGRAEQMETKVVAGEKAALKLLRKGDI